MKKNTKIISTLNLAVILMAAAFIIGTYGSMTGIQYSTSSAKTFTGFQVSGTSGIHCEIIQDALCASPKVKLFTISDLTNAHASIAGYPYAVCCEGNGLESISYLDTATTGALTVLKLTSFASAHAWSEK